MTFEGTPVKSRDAEIAHPQGWLGPIAQTHPIPSMKPPSIPLLRMATAYAEPAPKPCPVCLNRMWNCRTSRQRSFRKRPQH